MFTIRTTKPEKGNKFYNTKSNGGWNDCIKGSPTDKDCDVYNNCVGHIAGRFNEIAGKWKYNKLNCNAQDFITRAKSLGLKISQEPTLGGIMVFSKPSTKSGHVFINEKITRDNTGKVIEIYTSESAWNGKAFYNTTRTNANGCWGMGKGYEYLGCIVHPDVQEEPIPTPQPETQPTPVEPTFKVGDKVVPIELINYNGTHLKQYDKYYTITELKGDRAVLSAERKGKMIVWASMNTNNIKLYK